MNFERGGGYRESPQYATRQKFAEIITLAEEIVKETKLEKFLTATLTFRPRDYSYFDPFVRSTGKYQEIKPEAFAQLTSTIKTAHDLLKQIPDDTIQSQLLEEFVRNFKTKDKRVVYVLNILFLGKDEEEESEKFHKPFNPYDRNREY